MVEKEKIKLCAKNIVNAINIQKKGENILVRGGAYSQDLLEEIALEVYRNDGIPIITSTSDYYNETIYQDSSISSEILEITPLHYLKLIENIDAYIVIEPDEDPGVQGRAPREKLNAKIKFNAPLKDVLYGMKEEYAPGYIINWNLTKNMGWGTNWYFDKEQGTLEPGDITIVNFSFEPPTVRGDYGRTDDDRARISINNLNNTDESRGISFYMYYGLVELFPDADPIIFIKKGETKTFDNLIWVHSSRWEKLDWEIYDVSAENFDLSLIDYEFSPDNGTILPGDPLTPVSLYLDASNENFKGTNKELVIKIRRKNDPADNATISIIIWVIEGSGGSSSEWITPDGHEYNWWFFQS